LTIVPRLRLDHPASEDGAGLEVEIVATPRRNGADCLVDVFFDPARLNAKRKRRITRDPAFLEQIRSVLAGLGLPTGSLVYADAAPQEDHLVAFEAGSDLAGAVLERLAKNDARAAA